MARQPIHAVFNESLLPEGEKRWGSFGLSFIGQSIALAIVVVIPMLMPQKMEAVRHYWVTPLDAPHIDDWKPQPPPKPLPVVKKQVVQEVPKPVIEVPKPKIYNPVITAPKPIVTKKAPVPDPTQLVKAFPDPTPPVSLGNSAIPTLKKPREEVQTGGFGDPDGLPDNGKRDKNPNIAILGSYDMPAGPGQGNGTGGATGAKGVVASTGFGDGIALGTAGTSNRGKVQQGSFGDQVAVVAGPKVRQAAVSNSRPVEILFKPKPEYTDQARAKKIEGEVLLQVTFAASGTVKIDRVVQGLGYGLDETAQTAARQIRFHPAQQDGQLVDSDATVHITFALAY